ncbi:MAG TPA: hypothetical protein VHO02_05320 [Fibrobacteria bacterium]|nr:hypothetical protein [Fibrobacteria bacterium]
MREPLFPRTLAGTGISFLGGRPRRNESLGDEDLANLRIALGLHHDVLELCADPHLFESEDLLAPRRSR